MSLARKFIRVFRSRYHNWQARYLRLADGVYLSPNPVTHITERCGSEQFGAAGEAEYDRWWQEACGIVALQTVTCALNPAGQTKHTLFQQIQEAIQSGAYLQYKKGDAVVSVGWIHDKLVAIASKSQIHGYSASLTVRAICQSIVQDRLVIASVYRPFARFIDEGAAREKRGGHLIVVKGFVWKNGRCAGLFVEDPYDINERSEPIGAQLFNDVYSGSAIVFYA